MTDDHHYQMLGSAFVRGRSLTDGNPELPSDLLHTPLEQLDDPQRASLFQAGVAAGLRMNKFKKTMGLPRVKRVLGVLRCVCPTAILDIGSGRGAFLWPLLDEFPQTDVTAIDHSPQRAMDLQAVHDGGIQRLTAHQDDVTNLSFDNDQFDVVTMLEVLEHIPLTEAALSEVCRVARRFVILSVPSKEDDNPEHIHLFNEDRLRSLLQQSGVWHVGFDYVPGHIVAVASLP